MANIIEKIFHLEKRELNRYAREADRVIAYEKEMRALTDDELRAKTAATANALMFISTCFSRFTYADGRLRRRGRRPTFIYIDVRRGRKFILPRGFISASVLRLLRLEALRRRCSAFFLF